MFDVDWWGRNLHYRLSESACRKDRVCLRFDSLCFGDCQEEAKVLYIRSWDVIVCLFGATVRFSSRKLDQQHTLEICIFLISSRRRGTPCSQTIFMDVGQSWFGSPDLSPNAAVTSDRLIVGVVVLRWRIGDLGVSTRLGNCRQVRMSDFWHWASLDLTLGCEYSMYLEGLSKLDQISSVSFDFRECCGRPRQSRLRKRQSSWNTSSPDNLQIDDGVVVGVVISCSPQACLFGVCYLGRGL